MTGGSSNNEFTRLTFSEKGTTPCIIPYTQVKISWFTRATGISLQATWHGSLVHIITGTGKSLW